MPKRHFHVEIFGDKMNVSGENGNCEVFLRVSDALIDELIECIKHPVLLHEYVSKKSSQSTVKALKANVYPATAKVAVSMGCT